MEGWIKLYRASANHWVFKDPEVWKTWSYCLLDATHAYCQRRSRGRLVDLYPGQTIFGRNEWEKILCIDGNKLYRTILLFKDAGMIDIFPSNKHSIITICNWSNYQSRKSEQQNAQQTEQQNEQHECEENSDINADNEQQNEQQMNSKTTHNKNGKNEKKKDIKYTSDFESFFADYPNQFNKEQTFSNWKSSLKKGATVEQIMSALSNYKQYLVDNNVDNKYIVRSTNFVGQKQEYKGYLVYKPQQKVDQQQPKRNVPGTAETMEEINRLQQMINGGQIHEDITQ